MKDAYPGMMVDGRPRRDSPDAHAESVVPDELRDAALHGEIELVG